MSEPKHTPTLILKRHGYETSYACHEFLETPDGQHAVGLWNHDGNADRTAFRDAILTAVNSHAELVNMAERYRERLQTEADAGVITHDDRLTLVELDDLIARAKEGKQ